MDIKSKPTRATLKSYFVKNAIPTQRNFEDLIDGLINQVDDGIAKPPGEPLSVQADVSDAGLKKVINFYKNFTDQKPAWTLSLNPRIDPNVAATAKPGWSVGDADGNSKLFIDESTGNIGIGTVNPGGYKLNLSGSVLFTGNYLHVNSENAGRLRVGAAWGMPGLYSSDDGAKPLTLGVPAGQKVYLGVSTGDAFVEGGTGNSYFKGNVGIGTPSPAGKLEVNGAAVISNGNSYATRSNYMASGSLTVGGITANYGGGRGWTTNTAGLLLETASNTEIAVHDSGLRLASLLYYEGEDANRITIGRDMGWGAINQVSFAGAITPSAGNSEQNGILFPKNAFGGGGDAAWLRYYARTTESCTLELGIANDGDDHIALMSSGGVGIGTTAPFGKFDVNGVARVASLHNAARDPDSGMSHGGSLVIKSNAPQIDFIDTDHNDWSIHVNGNKMYFIRQPWNYSDLVLDGNGNVGIGTDGPTSKLEVSGPVMERLDVIGCGGRGDWTAGNHPIMNYFRTKLSGKPVGTYIKAIQDHPSWRGHYWQGWVDVDGRIRVIHNHHNTGAVV